jgi:hypothetical protein
VDCLVDCHAQPQRGTHRSHGGNSAVCAGALSRVWSLYLFIGNAAGYFLGDYVHGVLHGTTGKLAWGLLYGVGFGAGIGASLYSVQAGIRSRIQAGELR